LFLSAHNKKSEMVEQTFIKLTISKLINATICQANSPGMETGHLSSHTLLLSGQRSGKEMKILHR
jgi:hypothetical protein